MNAPVRRRGDRCFSTRAVMVVGVKSKLAALTECLKLAAPHPAGYIGLWSGGKVDWRPVPNGEAHERLLESVMKEARAAIPAGSDITPPCETTGEMYLLFPQDETQTRGDADE